MRIAFIVNTFPCLSQTFILDQIIGLVDRGHSVDIFAAQREDNEKLHPQVLAYNLQNNTYYDPLIPANYLLRSLKAVVLILAYIFRNPYILLKVFLSRTNTPVIGILFALFPLINKSSYDIIYCHFGPNGNKAMILRKIGAVTGKLLTVFHGYDLSSYLKEQDNSHIYSHLFKQGDLFLPISDLWKSRLIELGCSPEKIVVHRMGIDVDKFIFKPRQIGADEKVRIVSIARLVSKKGIEYGIRAMERMTKTLEKFEYIVVGDGPLRNELEKLIDQLGVNQYVKLLGWKEQPEILEILSRSHIFLAPSITSETEDQEGIPVVLMEAMASGLPVISTKHGGIPELVKDKVSGFLVPEKSVDDLVDKLSYLINHPELWLEMGKAGRNFIVENYNIEKLNDTLVKIYERVIYE
jgi:colanic acid/amylovoran biosynthesis glycosyltransferase